MENYVLSTEEAKHLLKMPKIADSQSPIDLSIVAGKQEVKLLSGDRQEQFRLTFENKGRHETKASYQIIWQDNIVLARLDLGGRGHKNPGGQKISVPHMHIYQAGAGDDWAYQVSALPNGLVFKSPAQNDDLKAWLMEFFAFCNVQNAKHVLH